MQSGAGMQCCAGAGGGGAGGEWGWRYAVRRMRRALLLLALAAAAAGALLYWCAARDPPRRLHALHALRRASLSRAAHGDHEPPYTWRCVRGECERAPYAAGAGTAREPRRSHATCAMLCASTMLWPQPTGAVSLAADTLPVHSARMRLQLVPAGPAAAAGAGAHDLAHHVRLAFDALRDHVRALERAADGPGPGPEHAHLLVTVVVNGSADPRLLLDTDESYSLRLTERAGAGELAAEVRAASYCGARHGLQTLAQLVWWDEWALQAAGALQGSAVAVRGGSVRDAPRFPYRALLLDTARNYFPPEDLLRTLDAMAAVKLNTFHWHATDSQSFPLRLESVPQLSEGAGAGGQVYTADTVRRVVRHARALGIRVLIEVDAPGHVGAAWARAAPAAPAGASTGGGAGAGTGDEQLLLCHRYRPYQAWCGEPPCGQLNPRSPHVYALLERVYRELLHLTNVTDAFHLGGDEVSERCWQHHFNQSDPMELWLQFERGALAALRRANHGQLPRLTLLWSSRLTRPPYLARLPRALALHVWGASSWPDTRDALDAGFRVVASHVDAWYLDCGFGSWLDSGEGACGPYRSWQRVYAHRPWQPAAAAAAAAAAGGEEEAARYWGGGAALWTEQVGPAALDDRLWPRAAALAERLWTDPPPPPQPPPLQTIPLDVYRRLDGMTARLWARGVRAAPLWPAYCSRHPARCLPAPATAPAQPT